MARTRWFDLDDNSLRSFIISMLLAIVLGGLAVLCLTGLQIAGANANTWRFVFGITTIIHLIALLPNGEEWKSIHPWDLACMFGPLIAIIFLSSGSPNIVSEWIPRVLVAVVVGITAFVWGMIAFRIGRFGYDHGFQKVVEDFD